jgi:ribosomal protein S19E (S16A)
MDIRVLNHVAAEIIQPQKEKKGREIIYGSEINRATAPPHVLKLQDAIEESVLRSLSLGCLVQGLERRG